MISLIPRRRRRPQIRTWTNRTRLTLPNHWKWDHLFFSFHTRWAIVPFAYQSSGLTVVVQLSGGSPWRILNDGRWRVFQHHELPETGPLGMEVERIQGLPGKAETISNTIINELDNSVKQTRAIILSSSREAAQKNTYPGLCFCHFNLCHYPPLHWRVQHPRG